MSKPEKFEHLPRLVFSSLRTMRKAVEILASRVHPLLGHSFINHKGWNVSLGNRRETFLYMRRIHKNWALFSFLIVIVGAAPSWESVSSARRTICGTSSIVREPGRAWNWLAVTRGNGGRACTPACRIPLRATRKSLPARDGLRIHAVLTDGQRPRLVRCASSQSHCQYR